MILQWLRSLPSLVLDSWREARQEARELAEAEYSRLHPVAGPPTALDSMLHNLWGDEIVRQLSAVDRFEQNVRIFKAQAASREEDDW